MDFIQDQSGRHLLRLEQLTTVPPYVKSASVDAESLVELGDHLFADPQHREFPCDSPGHTFLSYAYHRSANSGSTLVRERIKSAAERHGITADLDALDIVFEGLEKQAQVVAQPNFAIQVDFGAGNPESDNVHVKQGGVHGFYPIGTPEMIEISAQRLGNDRSRVPMELFSEGCQNIVKAARAAGMSHNQLPEVVWQYGEERLPDYDYVNHEAEMRFKLTGDETYREMAKMASENPELRPVQDFVEIWSLADLANGVQYNASHPDPYFIFGSGTLKIAHDAELNRWTLINDVAIPKSAIAALPEDRVQKHLNKEAAAQVVALTKKAGAGEDLDPDIAALSPDTRKVVLRLLAA